MILLMDPFALGAALLTILVYIIAGLIISVRIPQYWKDFRSRNHERFATRSDPSASMGQNGTASLFSTTRSLNFFLSVVLLLWCLAAGGLRTAWWLTLTTVSTEEAFYGESPANDTGLQSSNRTGFVSSIHLDSLQNHGISLRRSTGDISLPFSNAASETVSSGLQSMTSNVTGAPRPFREKDVPRAINAAFLVVVLATLKPLFIILYALLMRLSSKSAQTLPVSSKLPPFEFYNSLGDSSEPQEMRVVTEAFGQTRDSSFCPTNTVNADFEEYAGMSFSSHFGEEQNTRVDAPPAQMLWVEVPHSEYNYCNPPSASVEPLGETIPFSSSHLDDINGFYDYTIQNAPMETNVIFTVPPLEVDKLRSRISSRSTTARRSLAIEETLSTAEMSGSAAMTSYYSSREEEDGAFRDADRTSATNSRSTTTARTIAHESRMWLERVMDEMDSHSDDDELRTGNDAEWNAGHTKRHSRTADDVNNAQGNDRQSFDDLDAEKWRYAQERLHVPLGHESELDNSAALEWSGPMDVELSGIPFTAHTTGDLNANSSPATIVKRGNSSSIQQFAASAGDSGKRRQSEEDDDNLRVKSMIMEKQRNAPNDDDLMNRAFGMRQKGCSCSCERIALLGSRIKRAAGWWPQWVLNRPKPVFLIPQSSEMETRRFRLALRFRHAYLVEPTGVNDVDTTMVSVEETRRNRLKAHMPPDSRHKSDKGSSAGGGGIQSFDERGLHAQFVQCKPVESKQNSTRRDAEILRRLPKTLTANELWYMSASWTSTVAIRPYLLFLLATVVTSIAVVVCDLHANVRICEERLSELESCVNVKHQYGGLSFELVIPRTYTMLTIAIDLLCIVIFLEHSTVFVSTIGRRGTKSAARSMFLFVSMSLSCVVFLCDISLFSKLRYSSAWLIFEFFTDVCNAAVAATFAVRLGTSDGKRFRLFYLIQRVFAHIWCVSGVCRKIAGAFQPSSNESQEMFPYYEDRSDDDGAESRGNNAGHQLASINTARN